MNLFKIACINYDSNPVYYQGNYTKRNELISLQKVISDMGKEAIESVLEQRNIESLDIDYSPERAEMTAHESGPDTRFRAESNLS